MKMKLRISKQWWQFWLPTYVEIDEKVAREVRLPGVVDSILNSSALAGRIVKANARKEFEPFERRKGGRVVRNMPRQLKEIKEAQSAVPEVPSED
jgi:hypothetical protein